MQYATNTLARFGAAPREGHTKIAIGIFGYLRYNYRGSTMFDIEYPDTSKAEFKHNYWIDIYPYTEEAIPSNPPMPMNRRKLRVSVMIYVSQASELITRRIVPGFFIVVGRNIVKLYSKGQNNVENSIYRSELVALWIAI